MADNYIVQLDDDGTIDDNIILAVDDKGDELLRFGIPIEDKWVKCRYPRWGQWHLFQMAVKKIFMQFGTECDNIPLPNLDDPVVYRASIKHWTLLQAAIQVQKGMVEMIDKAFFEYLRPTVDGVENDKVQAWIYENAPITLPFLMFSALLKPEQWAKKKALEILEETFQTSMRPISADIYTPNSDGAKPILQIVPRFALQ